MTNAKPLAFSQAVFISFAAGLASALLCIVLRPQSMFGVLLFLISPLPLIIAGLSYHALIAALGALIGCLFLSLFQGTSLAIGYAALAGLPAWLVCEAALRKVTVSERASISTGTILLAIGLYVATLIVAATIWISPDYTEMRKFLYSAFEETIRAQYGLEAKDSLVLPDGTDFAPIGRIYARVMPGLAALPFFIMIALSGYLGARITRMSGRLQRNWPDFRTIQLPSITLPMLAAAMLLILAPGYIGLAGEVFTLVLALCFMLQGLAVLHFSAVAKPGLRWLIGTSWVLIFIFGFFGLGFAMLGVADILFDFRKLRKADTNPPSHQNS